MDDSRLPKEISVREQAEAAGRAAIRPLGDVDEIDRLRQHCSSAIDALGAGDGSAMARTKLAEMIFWMRAQKEGSARKG